VTVQHPDPATWRVGTTATTATTAQVLRLRLTDVPGWHATADGRPLGVYSWDGVMLQVVVPAGTRHVTVWYRPTTFDLGVVLAVVGGVGALVLLAWGPVRRRRTG